MTNVVACFAGSDGDFVQISGNGTNSNYHEADHQFSSKLSKQRSSLWEMLLCLKLNFWVIGSFLSCCHAFVIYASSNDQSLRIFNVD